MQTKAKEYIDGRGWKYKVMPPEFGKGGFKVAFLKPGGRWRRSTKTVFPWRETFEETQQDLDQVAKSSGWKLLGGGR